MMPAPIRLEQRFAMVSVDTLRPHPKNPNRGDLSAIASSLEKNGFYGAIVAQKSSGHIIVGNHRYQAAVKAGAAEVPVIWLDVDDRTAKRILLADNGTRRKATTDEPLLKELLGSFDGDVLGLGYDQREIDKLFRELEPVPYLAQFAEPSVEAGHALAEGVRAALPLSQQDYRGNHDVAPSTEHVSERVTPSPPPFDSLAGETSASGRWPLAIVLSTAERATWEAAKKRLGVADDKTGFIALLRHLTQEGRENAF